MFVWIVVIGLQSKVKMIMIEYYYEGKIGSYYEDYYYYYGYYYCYYYYCYYCY